MVTMASGTKFWQLKMTEEKSRHFGNPCVGIACQGSVFGRVRVYGPSVIKKSYTFASNINSSGSYSSLFHHWLRYKHFGLDMSHTPIQLAKRVGVRGKVSLKHIPETECFSQL